jgi:tetratricopeptide (TPR) repeat protein
VIKRANLHKKEEPGPKSLADGARGNQDSYARDKTKMSDYYRTWDNVDVDALEAEVDEAERKEEEEKRRHFEDLKDQQEEAHSVTPIQVSGVAGNVPMAHRKHMADSEKEKGNEAFYAKDFEEAEAYYSRSLQYRADDPSTWANRALVRLKLERPDAALEDCEHALAVNPRYMKALHRKGKALYDLQRYEDAVRSFQLALAESPGNTQINGDLMVARRKLRSAPAAPAAPPSAPSGKVTRHPTGCVIEELDPDPDVGVAAPQAASPDPSYTRVVIEEDSDSDSDGGAGGDTAVASAPDRGFRKVVIEEVSGSEDEEAAEPTATASAAPQGSSGGSQGFRKVPITEDSDSDEDIGSAAVSGRGGAFAPPPRVSTASPPVAIPAVTAAQAAPMEPADGVSFDDMD